MLTKLDDMTLIRYGTRYRTRYLLEQGRYTLKLAGAERPPLDLPPDYLLRMEKAIARLEGADKDREIAAVESKYATLQQNALFNEGKIWRRKVAMRAEQASRFGAEVPDELLTIRRARTVPALLQSLYRTLGLIEQYATELSVVGDVASLVTEGRRIHDALAQADAEQEYKRLSELPAKVRELFRLKGELYVALKIVNGAGKARHAADPELAARYNLAILNRRGPKRGETEEAPTADPS